MTTDQARDYKEMYEVTNGDISWGRFKFMMRIFTRPDIKLLTWNANKQS